VVERAEETKPPKEVTPPSFSVERQEFLTAGCIRLKVLHTESSSASREFPLFEKVFTLTVDRATKTAGASWPAKFDPLAFVRSIGPSPEDYLSYWPIQERRRIGELTAEQIVSHFLEAQKKEEERRKKKNQKEPQQTGRALVIQTSLKTQDEETDSQPIEGKSTNWWLDKPGNTQYAPCVAAINLPLSPESLARLWQVMRATHQNPDLVEQIKGVIETELRKEKLLPEKEKNTLSDQLPVASQTLR